MFLCYPQNILVHLIWVIPFGIYSNLWSCSLIPIQKQFVEEQCVMIDYLIPYIGDFLRHNLILNTLITFYLTGITKIFFRVASTVRMIFPLFLLLRFLINSKNRVFINLDINMFFKSVSSSVIFFINKFISHYPYYNFRFFFLASVILYLLPTSTCSFFVFLFRISILTA